jgi:hypothetical protein
MAEKKVVHAKHVLTYLYYMECEETDAKKYDWLHQKVPNQVLVKARNKRSTLLGLTSTDHQQD